MNVLVDSSVWVDYFRGGKQSEQLDLLLDESLVSTNDLILAELIPYLKINRQARLVSLLQHVRNYPLNISWPGIIDLQIMCINGGLNKIGIPDLLIAQNAMNNNLMVFSIDSHFNRFEKVFGLQLLLPRDL